MSERGEEKVPAPPDTVFLKQSDLFENQPDEVLQAIVLQGQVLDFGEGAVVFRQGDQGDRLYIVISGVLEILTTRPDSSDAVPVAYLGSGEVIGELALLTGSPRTATVRCPEQAQLLTLEKPVFFDLLETLPTFGRNLCVVLAKRLEATTLKAPRASSKQLQGNLKYFDLATVIQTLIGAHQTGCLTVTQDGGKVRVAEILFLKGNIAKAKVRHLSGDDAVFQLFQATLEGEFSFTGRNVTEDDVQSDITMPAISLLMESVRLQDELPLLQAQARDVQHVYRQKSTQLEWQDAETVELAASIWARLKRGASIADLHRDIPRCSYAIYRTVVALMDAGQIE
ncbi:MAG: cyclic nucleotide-binding domain-containing protein [Vicinamibacteria bacterium]|nr:cyclic nucleotide-binding domain-containing protein [Vicinamibacteria bacterium]